MRRRLGCHAQAARGRQQPRAFGQRGGRIGPDVQQAIGNDGIEAARTEALQRGRAPDLESQVEAPALMRDLHPQRHRVEAEHLACRTDAFNKMLGQQSGSAAEFEHALTGPQTHAVGQDAAGLQLPLDRQPLVIRRQRRDAIHRSQAKTASSGPKQCA